MSWEKEVLEIEHRKALALAQGGPEAIAVQHSKGRLSIRERIDAVLDAGTFVEHGPGCRVCNPVGGGRDHGFQSSELCRWLRRGKRPSSRCWGRRFYVKGGARRMRPGYARAFMPKSWHCITKFR